jgi:hypothetical protein
MARVAPIPDPLVAACKYTTIAFVVGMMDDGKIGQADAEATLAAAFSQERFHCNDLGQRHFNSTRGLGFAPRARDNQTRNRQQSRDTRR